MLTLSDVRLALDDLYEKRHAALLKSASGKLADPELVDIRARIAALPAALTTAHPLADELAEADGAHDEAARVIYYATEAVLHDAGASEAARAAAKDVRAALVPTLAELRDALPAEVDRAHERRGFLADKAFKAKLALLPLSDGRTLADAATRMLDAGDRIGALLSARGDVVKSADRTDASHLRGEATAVLTDLRKNLAREVARNEKLPRDLVTQVFAYVDLLTAHRKPGAKAAPPPPAPPPPAPTT